MDPKYRPQNLHDALVRLNEECVEVAKECCKGLRFGLHDCDPNKDDGQMPNIERIKREFDDLVLAYGDMIRFYDEAFKMSPKRDVCDHLFTCVQLHDAKCVFCGIVRG